MFHSIQREKMKIFQRSVLAIWMCTIKLSEQSIAGITYKDDFDFRNRYQDVHECDPRYWHPLHMPDHCLKMYEKVIRSKVASTQPIRLVKDKPNSDIISNLLKAGVESAQDPRRSQGHSRRRSYKHSSRRSRKPSDKRSHESSNGRSQTDSNENGSMQDSNSSDDTYKPVDVHTSSEENKKKNIQHGESHTINDSDEDRAESDEDKHAEGSFQVNSDENKGAKVNEYRRNDSDESNVWQGPEYAREYKLANGYEHSDKNTKANEYTQAEIQTQAITLIRADESAQSYEYESSQEDESAEPDESPQTDVLEHPDQYALSDGYLQSGKFMQADGFAENRYLRANSDGNESEDSSELYDDEESSKSADKNALGGIYGESNFDFNGFSPMRSRRKKNKKYVTCYLSSLQSGELYSLPQSRRPPLTPHERMLNMVSKDAKKFPVVPALGFLPQFGLSTLYRLPVSGKTVNMIEKVSKNYAKSIQDTYAQAGIFPVTETLNTTHAQVPDVNKAFINELKYKIQGIVARRKNDIMKNNTREANIEDKNKGINNTLDNKNDEKLHKLVIKTHISNASKTIKRRHKKHKRKRHKKKHNKRNKKKGKKKVNKADSIS